MQKLASIQPRKSPFNLFNLKSAVGRLILAELSRPEVYVEEHRKAVHAAEQLASVEAQRALLNQIASDEAGFFEIGTKFNKI